MKRFLLIVMVVTGISAIAQVGIKTDNSFPDPSAGLDVSFINKGFLPPRMTFEQRNAILDPSEGLMIYCTNCNTDGTAGISVYEGGKWNMIYLICYEPYSPSSGSHTPSANQIIWNWNSVPIALGYFWNTVNDINTSNYIGTVTSNMETGLTCLTTYRRYVWAFNDCGFSYPCELSETTTQSPFSPAPTEGTNIPSPTQIIWNWNTVFGATGYKWSKTNNYSTATDMGTATTNTETGLTCNTAYTRYAWAYSACGNSTAVTLTQSTSLNPPASPTAGTHVPSTTRIIWNWNTVSGATGYKWSTTNSYSTATDMGTAIMKTETGLTCNTAYTRYVWAYSACGNSTSVTLTQSTSLNPPASPTAGTHVPSATQIIWNWNIVTGATGYKWSTTNNYATATDMSTATSKTETGLTCNTAYTRYAWAYSNCGNSTAININQTTSACLSTCGSTITINHVAGSVSPVTKTVIYGIVTNIPGELAKCWITSNLGADHQGTAVNDATEASAGWYWQFNRKQGYKHDGTTRTPNTTWITSISESSNWTTGNDPCTIELGSGWRIPTYSEWLNVDAGGAWTNWNGPWNSGLKLHTAGYLSAAGSLMSRGSYGSPWSSTQNNVSNGNDLLFYNSYCGSDASNKASGLTLRCVKD